MLKEEEADDTEIKKWNGGILFSIISNILISILPLFFGILALLNVSKDIHLLFFGVMFLSLSIILLVNAIGFIIGRKWERAIEKYLLTGWFWVLVIYVIVLWYSAEDLYPFIFGMAYMIFLGILTIYIFWWERSPNKNS